MQQDEHLAQDLLQFYNVAALRRTGPRQYAPFGQVPSFYLQLFPSVDGEPCPTPWESSPMLEFFIDEAEQFFELGTVGMIKSGLWEEDGVTQKDAALTALAINFNDNQFLIIRLLQEDYAEQVDLPRRARNQLLENRKLSTSLALFQEKSRVDGLTSIFNRTTFIELLHDEIKRCQLLEYPLALLILDIDDFKKVNDTYGHLTGDKVLQGMGLILKASLRKNDIVARYGGEEFAVLIPHEELGQIMLVAEKIRCNIAGMTLEEAPSITVSIGCTAYLPGESTEDFFKRADTALYKAKTSGKNRVCTS